MALAQYLGRAARRLAIPGTLAVAVVLSSTAAAAQVLVEGAAPRLCVDDRVAPGRLALALIGEARASAFAATSNAGGTSPEDLTEAEAMNVVRALERDVFQPGQGPFGPRIELSEDKAAAEAWQRLSRLATVELGGLTLGPKVDGGATYRLVLRGSSTRVETYNPVRLFDPRPVYEIRCEATSPGLPNSSQGARPVTPILPVETYPPSWRVRGAASDLHLWTTDLSAIKAATIGFSRDETADTETINVNGVVGLAFETDDLVWSTIPFVSWQYKEVTGTGDIDKFSPGVLLAHRAEQPGWGLHSRWEVAYLIDREQSSEQIKSRLYLDPTFRTPAGYLFGDWLVKNAPIRIRPEFTAIGDVTEVRDPGTSPLLVDGGSYHGLGFDLRFLFDVPSIDGLSLLVGRRHLWLSGDLDLDEAARWHGKLEYKFKTSPIGIALTFSEGRNDDTFQEEDTTAVELTFRR